MSPEFDSLSQYIDFPDQSLGLWGANAKLTSSKMIDKIGINIIKKVVVVI